MVDCSGIEKLNGTCIGECIREWAIAFLTVQTKNNDADHSKDDFTINQIIMYSNAKEVANIPKIGMEFFFDCDVLERKTSTICVLFLCRKYKFQLVSFWLVQGRDSQWIAAILICRLMAGNNVEKYDVDQLNIHYNCGTNCIECI